MGFLRVTGLGGLYLEGIIHEGAYFRNFTVILELQNVPHKIRPYIINGKIRLKWNFCRTSLGENLECLITLICSQSFS